MVVRDAVAHGVVGTHHVEQGGEERQGVSEGADSELLPQEAPHFPPRAIMRTTCTFSKTSDLLHICRDKVYCAQS